MHAIKGWQLIGWPRGRPQIDLSGAVGFNGYREANLLYVLVASLPRPPVQPSLVGWKRNVGLGAYFACLLVLSWERSKCGSLVWVGVTITTKQWLGHLLVVSTSASKLTITRTVGHARKLKWSDASREVIALINWTERDYVLSHITVGCTV